MNKKTKRTILAFLTLALMGGTLFPSTSEALKWKRILGLSCSGSPQQGDPRIWETGTFLNETWNSSRKAFCPVPDTSATPKTNWNRANVHVYDSNDNAGFYVAACVSRWDDIGGACGSGVGSGNSFEGRKVLEPSLSQFTAQNAADWGYILVDMPGCDPILSNICLPSHIRAIYFGE